MVIEAGIVMTGAILGTIGVAEAIYQANYSNHLSKHLHTYNLINIRRGTNNCYDKILKFNTIQTLYQLD